jgi:hypothetical protein
MIKTLNNLADIPSLPVAFLTLVLFICLCTNSIDISLNSRLGISFIFLLISQLHNKYNKCKAKSNWENYRQQRNLVTKN